MPVPVLPPSVTPGAVDLTPVYAMIGLWLVKEVGSAIVAGVRYLSSRTVEREDQDKKTFQAKLDDYHRRIEMVERGLIKTEQWGVELGELRGSIAQLSSSLQERSEKQKEFYVHELDKRDKKLEEALRSLEYNIRQDMTRSINDAQLFKRR